VGALVRFWSLADQYAEISDGAAMLNGYTPNEINEDVEIPDFVESLPACWCEIREGSLYLPEYQEHNGQTGKSRALAAKRKERSRKRHASVTPMSRSSVTQTGPEKRREEKNINTPLTPLGGNSTKPKQNPSDWSEVAKLLPDESPLNCARFRDCWSEWVQFRNETRKRLTAASVKKQIANLHAWGLDGAVASIENSISSGYQGLFEVAPKRDKAEDDFSWYDQMGTG